MGMGEPLQNYDAVLKAIRILSDDHGLAIPLSRITISTAGVIPGIRRLAEEAQFPNLSISLTGVRNETRNGLMPINRKYPVEDVFEAIRSLPSARQRRVMIECVMIRGITDLADQARSLAGMINSMPVKVNLIPLNGSRDVGMEPSTRESVLRFQQVLLEHGIATFIRRTRGDDVSGACGQLIRKYSNANADSL
jgi:23S rRNA (adenine2503-C2)-methyltransferase